MSIINEALKKTEQYIQVNPTQRPLPPKSKPKPFLLYILVLVCGFFLSHFIFNLLGNKAKTTTLIKNTTSAAKTPAQNIMAQTKETKISEPQTVIAPPPSVEEKRNSQTNFILSGIFFSDNGGYALVNNQIVRENDMVDGATVKMITVNTVELDNAGLTVRLHTNR